MVETETMVSGMERYRSATKSSLEFGRLIEWRSQIVIGAQELLSAPTAMPYAQAIQIPPNNATTAKGYVRN